MNRPVPEGYEGKFKHLYGGGKQILDKFGNRYDPPVQPNTQWEPLQCDREGFKDMFKSISFCWTFFGEWLLAKWRAWEEIPEMLGLASDYFFKATKDVMINGYNYWISLYFLMRALEIESWHCEVSGWIYDLNNYCLIAEDDISDVFDLINEDTIQHVVDVTTRIIG